MTEKKECWVPQIETPRDDSELHCPIGQLIAERIKYGVKDLNAVAVDYPWQTEPIWLGDKLAELKKELKKLIQEMTRAQPEERPSAHIVEQSLRKVRRISCTSS